MDPAQIEFVAEKESISILPNFTEDKLYLISVSKVTIGIFIQRFFYRPGGVMVTILASHAADRGSIPGCGRSASHQTVSGTVSAGDAHSLTRRINPPTASYRKGDEHLRRSR